MERKEFENEVDNYSKKCERLRKGRGLWEIELEEVD